MEFLRHAGLATYSFSSACIASFCVLPDGLPSHVLPRRAGIVHVGLAGNTFLRNFECRLSFKSQNSIKKVGEGGEMIADGAGERGPLGTWLNVCSGNIGCKI